MKQYLKCLLLLSFFLGGSEIASSQSFLKSNETGIPVLGNAHIEWVDFNNNGIEDIIISGNDASGLPIFDVYENNGDNTFSALGLPVTALKNSQFLLGDFNNDNQVDIVYTGRNSNDDPSTILLLNNGGTFSIQSSNLPNLKFASLATIDFNHDGNTDILIAGQDENNDISSELWLNENNGFIKSDIQLPELYNGTWAVTDFNQDGYDDFLISGESSIGIFNTKIYYNRYGLTVNETTNSLFSNLLIKDLELADFNQNGHVDLLIGGRDSFFDPFVKLLEFDQNSFTDLNATLPSLSSAVFESIDVNNDGDQDILLFGLDEVSQYQGKLFINDGNANFTENAAAIGEMASGGLTISDFDNDGVQDFYYSGFSDTDPESSIIQALYINENTDPNNPPALPTGLTTVSTEDSVRLEWNQTTDDLTAANSISYNIYVGTSAGETDIISPLSSLSDNYRYIDGISHSTNTFEILNSLEEGNYFWSVQAIDASGNVSAFSAEESFTICYKPNLGIDQQICKLDTLNLSIGENEDVVDWYSKSTGLLLANSNDLEYIVLENDTIIAKVTKPFGCTITDTVNIRMLDLPAQVLPANEQICEQEIIEYRLDLPDHTVNWYSALDGLLLSDVDSISFAVMKADTLIAEIINANNCFVLDSVIIEKLDLPVQEAKVDTSICEQTQFEWSISGDFQSVQWRSANDGLVAEDVNSFSKVYGQSDTLFIYKTNDGNCSVEDTVVINTRQLPTVDLGADLQVCQGDSAEINLNTGDWSSIVWESAQLGDLDFSSPSFQWKVLENDTISVVATDNFGCVNYDTLIIEKLDLPVYDIGADTTVCSGSEMLLTTSESFEEVNWFSSLNGQLAADNWFLEYVANETDTIWSEVFNASGCVVYDTIIISSVEPKQYDLGEDITTCFNDEISIEITDLTDSVNWFFEDSLLEYHGSNLQFSAVNSQTISIETINELGCTSYDSIYLEVNDLPAQVLPENEQICEQEIIEYKLNLPDHTVNWYSALDGLLLSDVDSISFIVLQSDTLIAEIINENNCFILDSVIIEKLDLPIQEVKVDTTICEQTQFEWLISGDFKSVQWHSANDGLVAEDVNSFNKVYEESDTLFINKTNLSNCSIEDTVVINTRQLPTVDLGADLQVCQGDSAQISLSTGNWSSIEWESAQLGRLDFTTPSFQWEVSENDTINVVATDNFGCVNYDTLIIEKLNLPEYDIGSDTIVCKGSEVLLTTSTGFSEVNWHSSLNGQISADNWFLEYVANETDTIWSEVFNANGCVTYDSILITANEPFQYSLGEDFEICKGELVNLSIQNLQDSINWYYGDSLLANHSNSLEFIAESNVSISIQTIDSLGCTSYDSLEISVNELPILDLPRLLEVCNGEELNISNSFNYDSMEWESKQFGLIAENVQEITYSPTVSDTLFLTAIDEDHCMNYDTLYITVHDLPEFSLGTDLQICEGENVILEIDNPADSINWFNDLGQQLLDTTAILNFEINQNQTWWAEQWNASSCVFSDTVQITNIPLPVFDAGDSVLICKDSEVQLNPVGIDESWAVAWSPSNLVSNPAIADPIAMPDEDSWFFLRVENENACFYEDSVFVALDKPIILNAGNDRTICLNDVTELGGTPTAKGSNFPYQYEWSPAESLDDPTAANPIADPTETTTYQLIAWAGECRADTAEVTVGIQLPPEITLTADTTIGAGDAIQLQASGGDFYQWKPERGLSDATIANPIANPVRTITYTMEVLDSLGCISDKEMTLFVENQLFIPNLFTPNNDGQNDFFKVYGAGIKEIEFKVFTRGGQLLYSTNSVEEAYGEGWDGKFNGNPVESGVYVWSIKGRYFDDRPLSFNGQQSGLINLMR
jgi:gliding motility-associated-like protein